MHNLLAASIRGPGGEGFGINGTIISKTFDGHPMGKWSLSVGTIIAGFNFMVCHESNRFCKQLKV